MCVLVCEYIYGVRASVEARTGHHISPLLTWVLGLKLSPFMERQVPLTTETTYVFLKLLNTLSLHLGRERGVQLKQQQKTTYPSRNI